MKCKVFTIYYINDGEDMINEWLNSQSGISIEYVSSVRIDEHKANLYIFYSNRKTKLENLNLINNDQES